MDEIITAIEEALRAKGLSAAAASRAAVGNPSLIKNLFNRKPNKRDHPIENLMKLADVLDLDFYFGPRRATRSMAMGGPAEPIPSSSLGPQDALRFGYQPIPWHPDAAPRMPVPVAFEGGWLATLDVPIEKLTVVQPETVDSGAWPDGGIALIEAAAQRIPELRPWCYLIDRKPRIGLVQFARQGALIMRQGVIQQIDLIPPGDSRIAFLGQVVWFGAVIPGHA